LALEHAAVECKADREIVWASTLEGIRWCPEEFDDAADEWKRNRDFVLAAVKVNPDLLCYRYENEQRLAERISGDIWDREHGMGNIQPEDEARVWESYRHRLHYDPDRDDADDSEDEFWRPLKGDLAFMLDVVRARGTDLQRAKRTLRGCRELVFEAVRQDSVALEFATRALRDDPDLQPERVRRNRVAGPGVAAPTVQARLVQLPDGSLEVDLACLDGKTAKVDFAAGATVGDLASAAVRQFQVPRRLVHLLVVGEVGRPVVVKPLEAGRPLVAHVPGDC